MSDQDQSADSVIELLASAEAFAARPAEVMGVDVDRIALLLRAVERATPGAASLHGQLDMVTKWVALLAKPGAHERFGGADRVRDHVAMQFRLARAAAEDYLRASA
jgi:hypothetical protein